MISFPSPLHYITAGYKAVIACGVTMLCSRVPLAIGRTSEAGSAARPSATVTMTQTRTFVSEVVLYIARQRGNWHRSLENRYGGSVVG
jgi:hypothetical protein